MTNCHKGKVLSILLAVTLLLCGCRDTGTPDGTDGNDSTRPDGGSVAVYVEEQYRPAFQLVFSSVKLSGENFSVHWVGDMASADVVITDQLSQEQYDSYRVLEPEKLPVQCVTELQLRDDRGVIGLPLLLQAEGFWYDAQLYQNYGVSVPQSLDSWNGSPIRTEYPAVYAVDDGETLFWAVVAPVYLHCGGKAEELATGQFQKDHLQTALLRLEQMASEGLLKSSEDPRQTFTTSQTCFWIAGMDQIAASYNYKTTVSSWNFTMSLPFSAREQAFSVVRAELVAVKETADQALTDRFLQLLYDQNTLEDLSSGTQMAIACQMQYNNGVVPEIPRICYTVLSSPSLKLAYVHCGWPVSRQETVYGAVLEVLQGSLTGSLAVQQIIQG